MQWLIEPPARWALWSLEDLPVLIIDRDVGKRLQTEYLVIMNPH
jgi:hypothetical protein